MEEKKQEKPEEKITAEAKPEEIKKEEAVEAKAAAPSQENKPVENAVPATEKEPITEDVVAEIIETAGKPEEIVKEIIQPGEALYSWAPKTQLGKDVFEGKYTDLNQILSQGLRIREFQIVDKLMPDVTYEIIYIGSSPGKGGGGKRTITRKTARMHKSGRRFRISALVVIGNQKGFVGIGIGTGREHRLAIEKAVERAKLNIISLKLGCGSWECGCNSEHSISAKTEGRSGSVRVVLLPAPKGVGLVVSDEMKKFFRVAGVKDVWSKTFGNTAARVNLMKAVYNAMKKLNQIR